MSMRRVIAGSLFATTALCGLPQIAAAQSAPSPYTTGHRYDAAGRETGSIAPDPDGAGPLNFVAVRYTYDAAGRVVKVESGELAAWQPEGIAPAAWTGFTIYKTVETNFDALDRKTIETNYGDSAIILVPLPFRSRLAGLGLNSL
ncbi:MAG: RHS repeat domain-containing protein [Novosphingobium sp.]|uniref:RHS repeat domain-containing protein n=1 Tax=Novosphingobium sp. TaxID=1874826 RepID=UPI0032BF16A6